MTSISNENLESIIKILSKHAITVIENTPYEETTCNDNDELKLHKEGINIIGKIYEIPDDIINQAFKEIEDAENSYEYNRNIEFVIEEGIELADVLNKAINMIENPEQKQVIKDLAEYICDFYDAYTEKNENILNVSM